MDKNITVGMIDTRSAVHPEWTATAINSVKNQILPVEMVVYNNIGRKKTIGACLNDMVRTIKTDWIFFLDDDDWISPDYLAILNYYIERNKESGLNPISICTYMTIVNDTENYQTIQRVHKGVIRRDYMLKYPWNEKLLHGVDREWFEEARKRNDPVQLIHYHYGYHYRQHNEHRARDEGNIEILKEPGDIYINSRYAQHTRMLAKMFQEKYKVVLTDAKFDPQLAEGAKVWWCDWGDDNAVAMGNYKTDAKKILRVHAYEAFTQMIYHVPFKKFDTVVFVAKHIKDYVESQVGEIPNAVVIPNGVDTDEYTIPDNKEVNNKIAYAGELSRKKGISLLMLLAEHFPAYDFHVAGKFHETDVADWFNKRKPKNVYLEPYSYNLNEFFKDKTYILNTSLREGCPQTMLQGMSAGLKPISYAWVGVENFPFYSFKNIDVFARHLMDIEGQNPQFYRDEILENYNIKKIFPKWEKIIGNNTNKYKNKVQNTSKSRFSRSVAGGI